jgi:integrase/recombinase XerD
VNRRRESWRTPLPFAAWPELDRERWHHALQAGDIFASGTATRRWGPATWVMVETGYGRWLRFLEQEGALDGTQDPGARITPQRVSCLLSRLRERCLDATIVIQLESLAAVAAVLAPGRDWSWLVGGARELRAGIAKRKAKLPRLRRIQTLYRLGLDLMAEAERLEVAPLKAAVRHRDGLLIALLAARPLRRANMAGLRLGTSLTRRGGSWWISLAAAETKTGRPIEVPLPEAVTAPLERYLDQHRPLLLAGGSDDHLWITKDGTWLRPHAVFARVTTLTRARLGVAINPHLFRDCAATSIALDDPAHVLITRDVLGHRTLATSQRHYNQAGSLEAARVWQAQVRRLRGRPETRAQRRKGTW